MGPMLNSPYRFRMFRLSCLAAFLFLVPACAQPAPRRVTQPTDRVPLKNIAAEYGYPTLQTSGTNAVMKSRYSSFSFIAESRQLLFNGHRIWMNAGAERTRSGWSLSEADRSRTLAPLLRPPKRTHHRTPVIVLDPGHGGADKGAESPRKIHEKKAVLDIAKRTVAHLAGKNVTVHLTRSGDTDMTLGQRSAAATRHKADVFVSIHLNSAANRQASGLETYVLTAPGFDSTSGRPGDRRARPGNVHDPASMALAYAVHRDVLNQKGGSDRGIKHARFGVLCDAPCPAILLECAFVSNVSEEEQLLDNAYRDRIAKGIALGILRYLERTAPAPEKKD